MLTLLIVVLVAIAGLIPGQDHVALGVELLGRPRSFTYATVRLSGPACRRATRRGVAGRPDLVHAIAVVPLSSAAISLIAEGGGGLYWIVGGILGAIVGAVANAWVLLVEILR